MSFSSAPQPRTHPREEGGGAGEENAGEEKTGLGEGDRKILKLESLNWKYTATKNRAIRERLNLEPVDYYLRLRQLEDDPRALAEFPALLRRLGERRRRVQGHFGIPTEDISQDQR